MDICSKFHWYQYILQLVKNMFQKFQKWFISTIISPSAVSTSSFSYNAIWMRMPRMKSVTVYTKQTTKSHTLFFAIPTRINDHDCFFSDTSNDFISRPIQQTNVPRDSHKQRPFGGESKTKKKQAKSTAPGRFKKGKSR